MKLAAVARRHPAGVYFGLAFAISWAGVLLAGGPAFLRGEVLEIEKLLPLGLFVLAGPSLAGLGMTYLLRGGVGVRALGSGMLAWRVGGRWYAPLLIFPALLLAVSLALSAWVSPEFRPIFFTPGILMGLLAGLIEEIGWMGFAYPAMRSRLGVLKATLWLGLLHAAWHALPSFIGAYSLLGAHWLPHFAGFFLYIVALRVLIVWVYENTGSLLLAQLMHVSSTGFFGILVPTDIAPVNWVIFYWAYAAVITAVAVAVVVKYGPNLASGRNAAG